MQVEIRKILRELLPYKKRLIVIAISGVLMAAAQGQIAVQMKTLFDALETKNADKIIYAPTLILILTFVMCSCRYIHLYLMNYTADQVTTSLRRKLQSKFMTLNLSFHNSFEGGSGGLISRILNDVVIVQNGLRMVADFFREPVLLFFLLGWLFILNWRLTLSIFVVLPIILLFIRQIARSLRKYGERSQETLESLTTTIKESLDGVRVIQSFNLENEMTQRFDDEADRYLAARKMVNKRIELAGPVTEFIATLVVIVIFTYLGLEISKGKATLGDFASFLASLLLLQAPIKKIQESYVRIQETVVALKRIYSIIEDDNLVPQTSHPKKFPTNWNKIEYKNVSFSYGREPLLQDVNLTINKGEIVAFVGESGSGKSTIVNLLERFFDPSRGEILIDHTPIKDISLQDLRNHIALVTQDVFLFSDSVEKNIHAGRFEKDVVAVSEAAQSANAHNFISQMPAKYQTRVGDRGNLLSGGEKQRISIARAIFKDAPILILDEATSALDSASEIEVQKGLDRLMHGKTTLVIAHRLSTIQHADKIVVLRKGRIVEVGTHQELLSKDGEYHRFFKLQNRL